MKHILILTLLTMGVAAHARLGETAEQIQKRYGNPIPFSIAYLAVDFGSGLAQTNYVFNGYKITVVYKEGKSVKETLEHRALEMIAEEEGINLIKAISGSTNLVLNGTKWTGEGVGGAANKSYVYVWSQTYIDAAEKHEQEEAARKKAESEKRVEGF